MISFLFWLAVIYGACAIICYLADKDEQRHKRRQRERLRERRTYLDSLPPREWNQ